MKRFNELIKASKPLLVDFYASWCGPCRVMSPLIDKLERKYDDKINVLKIDVDDEEDLASKYKIHTVPSLMMFKNGEIVWHGVGIQSQSMLEKVIKQFM